MPISKDNSISTSYHTLEANGTQVTVREMTGKDLVRFEKMISAKNASKMESILRLLEMISVSPNKITYVELENLSSKTVLELTRKMNEVTGLTDDEDD